VTDVDLTAYMAATDATAFYPHAGTRSMDAVEYVALAMLGETTEVLQKDDDGDRAGLVAELGDVLWLLARFYRELDADPYDDVQHAATLTCPRPNAVVALVVAAGRAGEKVKKVLRDDAGILSKARRNELTEALASVLATWLAVHERYGLDPAVTAQANLAKLADRRRRSVLTGSGDTR
jgi:NTP pyrophosphatase (non-canonical NTP hydrolase)